LNKAQQIYINEHSVDIASIWSTSTLALKIFRQSFLDCEIPNLNNNLDWYISKGYYGGATDHYYLYAEEGEHYDVNLLYPKGMLNPMPYEAI
jgi:hypothetical protein